MKLILLDANAILAKPDILSQHAEGVQFVLLPEVLEALLVAAPNHPWQLQTANLVNAAVVAGYAKIVSLSQFPGTAQFPVTIRSAHDALLQLLEILDEKGEDVTLCSDDGLTRHVARDIGYSTMTSAQALTFLNSQSSQSLPAMREQATAIKAANQKYALRHLAAGAVLGVLGNVAFGHVDAIIHTINVWGTVVSVPVLGAVLYGMRGRFRLAYGTVELVVGLTTALRVFLPTFDYARLTAAEELQIVAGLYVIVRGLDNMGIGLTGTRFAPQWNRVFQQR